MAFINALMTTEEKADFASKAIPNPGNPFHILEPYRWTINPDKNIFLVWTLEEREEPHDEHFLLGWEGTPLPVKLRSSWLDRDTRHWELLYVRIPEEYLDKRFEILQSLKDALTVYGYNGVPNDPFNASTKVKFNF